MVQTRTTDLVDLCLFILLTSWLLSNFLAKGRLVSLKGEEIQGFLHSLKNGLVIRSLLATLATYIYITVGELKVLAFVWPIPVFLFYWSVKILRENNQEEEK